jgi:hypothetical protein
MIETPPKSEVIPQPNENEQADEYMRLEMLRSRLMVDRAAYLDTWEEINRWLDPHLVIWDPSSSGFPNFDDVKITSYPFLAFDTLQAGLCTGITPENQDWHSIEPEDEELKTDEPSLDWCHKLNELYKWTFQNSNFYQEAPIFYRAGSRFLTAAMMCEEDFQNRCRYTVFPMGSYYCSNNGIGMVDTFIFETRFKLRQIVDLFCPKDSKGQPNVSNLASTYQFAWNDPKQRENPWNMVWAIEPNLDYDITKAKYNSRFKKYKASYYMRDSTEKRIIQQKGFDDFPVFVFRWFRQPTDAYGVDGPGRKALGDVKEIFRATGMWNNAVAKVIEPPMVAPPEVGQYPMGTIPGFLNVAPGAAKQGEGFRPAYQIQPDLKAIQEKRMELKTCIDKTCFADVFRMIANTDKTQPETATYWLQRIQENYNILAPMYGNFEHEWIKPMFRVMFSIFSRQGAFKQGGAVGPPPPQLAAKGLKFNVISAIPAALKILQTSGYDKGLLFLETAAKIYPQILDVFNLDEMGRRYFVACNLPGKLINGTDKIQAIRQQRAQQMAAQAKTEALPKIGKGAKDLAAAHAGISETQSNSPEGT